MIYKDKLFIYGDSTSSLERNKIWYNGIKIISKQ